MTIARTGPAVIVGTLATNETDQAKVNFAIRRLQEEINNNSEVPVFVGDSGSGGVKGLVPGPAAGEAAANKFLRAGGTWASIFGLSSRPTFKANLNGSDQTGIVAATSTKLNYATEVYDVGSYYDAANAKWTPPAGLVAIVHKAQFKGINIADQTNYLAQIYKNGALYEQQNYTTSGTGPIAPWFVLIDQASGSDFYEPYCQGGAPAEGNKTVNGSTTVSYWTGFLL
jgi:hypothetical protein